LAPLGAGAFSHGLAGGIVQDRMGGSLVGIIVLTKKLFHPLGENKKITTPFLYTTKLSSVMFLQLHKAALSKVLLIFDKALIP
jgi:hypothetical protein